MPIMESSENLAGRGELKGHERTNFKQTCTLLSQYLKEKGTLADLKLGMARNNNRAEDGASVFPDDVFHYYSAAPMNLFPVTRKPTGISDGTSLLMDLFPQNSDSRSRISTRDLQKTDLGSSASPSDTSSQMTIFYGGEVRVFDDFPSDKARELMLLASSASSRNCSSTTSPVRNRRLNNNSSGYSSSTSSADHPNPHRPPITSSVFPIMRNASLQRFLAKRKDRIAARAPYDASKTAASKAGVHSSTTWLELAVPPSHDIITHRA